MLFHREEHAVVECPLAALGMGLTQRYRAGAYTGFGGFCFTASTATGPVCSSPTHCCLPSPHLVPALLPSYSRTAEAPTSGFSLWKSPCTCPTAFLYQPSWYKRSCKATANCHSRCFCSQKPYCPCSSSLSFMNTQGAS